MIALLQAIKRKFDNDGQLVQLFPGGMWRNDAGEGATMPYVVSDVLSAPSDTYYGDSNINEDVVRFTAYGTDHDVVGAAMEVLDSKYKGAILTLVTGTHVNVRRTQEPRPVPQPTVDANNNEVWAWTATYVFNTYTP